MTFNIAVKQMYACVAVLILYCVVTGSAATIKDVQIPHYVENGSASIDLMCEFVRGEMDKYLVLKWFHSGDSSPVFLWIPELDLFEVSGIFRGHVSPDEARKMSSTKSDDLTSKFGIRLEKPTIKHEGKYKCYVTSEANTDERESELTIFVPPHETSLVYNSDRRMMTCRSDGVYPLPKVTLYRSSKKGDLVEETEFVRREDKLLEDGTYNVLVTKYMSSAPPERFECWTFLDIDYKVLAKAHYMPGKESIMKASVTTTSSGACCTETAFALSTSLAILLFASV